MNDASVWLSLKFAVAVAVDDGATVGGATLECKVAIGGILAGFVVGWLAMAARCVFEPLGRR